MDASGTCGRIDLDNLFQVAQIDGQAGLDRNGAAHQSRTATERHQRDFFRVGELDDAAHLVRRLRFDGAEWRVQLGMMVRVHATLAERIPGKLVEHGGIRDNPCRIDYLRKFAGNVAHGVRVYYRLIESISQSWQAKK